MAALKLQSAAVQAYTGLCVLVAIAQLNVAFAHTCIHDEITQGLGSFLATRPDNNQTYIHDDQVHSRRLSATIGNLRIKLDFSRIETTLYVVIMSILLQRISTRLPAETLNSYAQHLVRVILQQSTHLLGTHKFVQQMMF